MKKTNKKTLQNKKIKPVFNDKRGSIYDLVEEKVGHIGICTFKKGAVRGNHYHKKSVQYSYILKGKIELITNDINGGNRKKNILTPGILTTIPTNLVHTYIALTDAELIDITTMSRNNNGYEKDTIRVNKKI